MSIGLDLTQLLSPANIPGVKAYLGVESDTELVGAIARDRYTKIEQLLQGAGFDILNANFKQIKSENQNIPAETVNSNDMKDAEKKYEVSSQPKVDNDPNLEPITYDVNAYLLDKLKPIIEKSRQEHVEITTIVINGHYVAYMISPAELKSLAKLEDDVEIEYDDLDKGQLAIVNMVDSEANMTFETIKEKETEKTANGKD